MNKEKKDNGITIEEVSHVTVPKDKLKEQYIECDVCGTHNPSASAVDANGVVEFAQGYTYTVTVEDASFNGRIYNFN